MENLNDFYWLSSRDSESPQEPFAEEIFSEKFTCLGNTKYEVRLDTDGKKNGICTLTVSHLRSAIELVMDEECLRLLIEDLQTLKEELLK